MYHTRASGPKRLTVGLVMVCGAILAACGGGSNASAKTTSSTGVRPSTTVGASSTSTAPTSTTIASTSGIDPGYQPLSVSFVSPSLGYALGYYQCSSGTCYEMAQTTDSGGNWTLVGPAGSVLSNMNPQGIYFADAAHGWAWGKGAAFTADGGKSWSVVSLPAGSVVDSVAVVGVQVYYLLSTPTSSPPGSYILSLFEQNWQTGVGATPVGGFSPVAASSVGGSLAASASMLGIDTGQASSSTPVWLYNPGPGTAVALKDPCASTTSSLAPVIAGARYLAQGTADPASDAVLYALCGASPAAGSSGKEIYQMSNLPQATSKTAWTALTSSAPIGGLPTSLAVSQSASLAVGAASGASFIYTQAGGASSWNTLTDSSLGGAPVTQMAWIDDSHVFGVVGGPGGPSLGPSSSSVAYYSSDGGANFTKLSF